MVGSRIPGPAELQDPHVTGYAGTAMSTDRDPDALPAPEVVTVSARRVACDGDDGPLGHPRVWLLIGALGFVDCPYCDRRFQLADGAR